MSDLTNKTALVLGGSRGIGKAIVERLAKGGAKTIFTYAGSKDAAETLAKATNTTAVQTDSANRDALIATVAAQGPLDILVINAGTLVLGDPLTIDPDAVDRMIDVNVRAAYLAGPHAAIITGSMQTIDGGFGA
jgi:cyclic-di-GMP-binding biofilm dispersal mediator protein